jgi:hypothetical protein
MGTALEEEGRRGEEGGKIIRSRRRKRGGK